MMSAYFSYQTLYNYYYITYTLSLFRKKRFEINFFVRRNASKFAIFIEKKNPCSFFRFSFREVKIDQGIHKGKLKNALNEKRKKLFGFSFSINIANFEAFLRTKNVDLKPLFSEKFSSKYNIYLD